MSGNIIKNLSSWDSFHTVCRYIYVVKQSDTDVSTTISFGETIDVGFHMGETILAILSIADHERFCWC